jgi:bifunctional DNase/RNase
MQVSNLDSLRSQAVWKVAVRQTRIIQPICLQYHGYRSIRKLHKGAREKRPFVFEIYTGVSTAQGSGVAIMVILSSVECVYSAVSLPGVPFSRNK